MASWVRVQVVGIPTIVISYAVDSYKSLPGEIMIAATIVKNTFGVSFPPVLLVSLASTNDMIVWHGIFLQ